MLSNVEEELRNPAAHTMVAFDKEKSKKSPETILKKSITQ